MAQSVTLLVLYFVLVYEFISESDELLLTDASPLWLILRRMIDRFLLLIRLSVFISVLFFMLLPFSLLFDDEFDVFVIVMALCLSILAVIFLGVKQVLELTVFVVG